MMDKLKPPKFLDLQFSKASIVALSKLLILFLFILFLREIFLLYCDEIVVSAPNCKLLFERVVVCSYQIQILVPV